MSSLNIGSALFWLTGVAGLTFALISDEILIIVSVIALALGLLSFEWHSWYEERDREIRAEARKLELECEKLELEIRRLEEAEQ